MAWPYKGYRIPDCYGYFHSEDCVVSCPVHQDCMEEQENIREQQEREWFWFTTYWQEWAEEHGYDPNTLEFVERADGVDVFVGGE